VLSSTRLKLEMATDTTSQDAVRPSFMQDLKISLQRKGQNFLDSTTRYVMLRWVFLLGLIALYCIRVYFLEGFYIVTYGLGIFLLNLFIGFLTPLEDTDSDPVLPMNETDEFRPFQRRLPEFKFWLACTKAMLFGFTLTFIPMFDVPVFWPILLIYFIVLFCLTMKRQIKHMLKHKYVPFTVGKKRYKGKPQVESDIRTK